MDIHQPGGERIMRTNTVLLIFALVAFAFILSTSAAGQGYGAGNNAAVRLALPDPADYNLSTTEIADLVFMREEEQMSKDLYTIWSAQYSLPIFSNIAQAEETHLSEVQYLLDRYNLSSTKIGTLAEGYENPVILELSTNLVEQGNISLNDALRAGVMIEEQDISDLDKAIANTTREDLKIVYENLRSGSENHLSAFNKQIS